MHKLLLATPVSHRGVVVQVLAASLPPPANGPGKAAGNCSNVCAAAVHAGDWLDSLASDFSLSLVPAIVALSLISL